jgi:antitoxin MazE
MKTKIIRIGNSQGIRIPKPLLDESGLGEEVELKVEPGRIVIRSTDVPGRGWAAAFRRMAKRGDDALLDPEAATGSSWDEEEWRW